MFGVPKNAGNAAAPHYSCVLHTDKSERNCLDGTIGSIIVCLMNPVFEVACHPPQGVACNFNKIETPRVVDIVQDDKFVCNPAADENNSPKFLIF